MKIALTPRHVDILGALGHANPPLYIETTEEEVRDAEKKVLAALQRSGQDHTEDEVADRTITHLAWEQHVGSLTSPPIVPPTPSQMLSVGHIEKIFSTFQDTLAAKNQDQSDKINAHVSRRYDEHARMAMESHNAIAAHIVNARGELEESADRRQVETHQALSRHLAISIAHGNAAAMFRKLFIKLAYAALFLLLVIIGLQIFSLKAHAQFSHVNYIQFQNNGTPVSGGFFAYPFTFNFVGCTGSAASGTITLTCTTGGSGTVTQVTPATGAGAITNLGTFGFSSQTTTPALTIGLTNAGAHLFFGNNTGSTAAPGYQSIGRA